MRWWNERVMEREVRREIAEGKSHVGRECKERVRVSQSEKGGARDYSESMRYVETTGRRRLTSRARPLGRQILDISIPKLHPRQEILTERHSGGRTLAEVIRMWW